MTVDLEQFVDKNVSVTFRDGRKFVGRIGQNKYNGIYPYVLLTTEGKYSYLPDTHTKDGSFNVDQEEQDDIVGIKLVKEAKEEIFDLDQFGNQAVVVTCRGGSPREGILTESGDPTYPYEFCPLKSLNIPYSYTSRGAFFSFMDDGADIVDIKLAQKKEEPEATNKLEELEER